MFSKDSNSGLMVSLMGVIVLVFTGIGLSIIVEKRMRSSGDAAAVAREVETNRQELDQLRVTRDMLGSRLDREGPARGHAAAAMTALAQPEDLAERAKRAAGRAAALGSEATALEREFAEYRERYRHYEWNRARGEKLGDLVLPGGREYRNAVIRRVTADGLDVRHDDGNARISPHDLDPRWRDRFQWEERTRLTRP